MAQIQAFSGMIQIKTKKPKKLEVPGPMMWLKMLEYYVWDLLQSFAVVVLAAQATCCFGKQPHAPSQASQ